MWERSNDWLPPIYALDQGPNPQPRHVPWPAIQSATFHFVECHPTESHRLGLIYLCPTLPDFVSCPCTSPCFHMLSLYLECPNSCLTLNSHLWFSSNMTSFKSSPLLLSILCTCSTYFPTNLWSTKNIFMYCMNLRSSTISSTYKASQNKMLNEEMNGIKCTLESD